ncbi:uncharacterized protein [Diabrotica undecimpunctata]|uniref:uncharacterized protein n=1 Tax=Diabrotica undecimpunctata TaxID=50387 RepID=UPI003B635502
MYQSNMPVNQQYFPPQNGNQCGGRIYRPQYSPPLLQISPSVAPSYGVPRLSYQSSGTSIMAQRYDLYNRAPPNYPRIVPNRIVQSNVKLAGNHQEMRHVQNNSSVSSANHPDFSRLPNQKDQFTNVSTEHKPYYGNFKEPLNKRPLNYTMPMETSTVEQDHNVNRPVTTRNLQNNNIGIIDGQRSNFGTKRYKFDLNEKNNVSETVSNPSISNNTTISSMNRTMEMVPTTGSIKTNSTTARKSSESSQDEKQFIFTGPVDKVIHWNMLFQDRFCLYEIIATMVSLQEGTIKTQKIMLVRNTKGPVLQVVYYLFTQIDLDDFHLGMTVRCVGSMIGFNILKAISIRAATQEEIDHLERMSLISDQAVSFQLTHS